MQIRMRFGALRWWLAVGVVLGLLAGCAPVAAPAGETAGAAPAASGEKVKLTLLTHWGEEALLKAMQAKLDEYMAANPNVTIEYQTVPFDQLLTKIVSGRTAGISPDIYHFYNLWLPELVNGDALAEPPDEIQADIKENYSPSSLNAVSAGGKLWGYATEINTYQLIYNKKLLKEAGFDNPPATWSEMKEMAAKISQKDANGQVAQTGVGLITGWDSGVVHPFLSLLWSHGGTYLDVDNAKASFNDAKGLETLQLYKDLIDSGGADVSVKGMDDFVAGKVGMIIMANWWRASLQQSFADGYENVGVAPIPHADGSESTTLQYNWLFGVDKNSAQQAEAWKFVQWLNNSAEANKLTPIGDYLYNALGAIPSRKSDQAVIEPQLDDFLKAYAASTATSIPEPVLAGGQEIKTKLQTEIEAAWFGQKSPQEALDAAAAEADQILLEKQ